MSYLQQPKTITYEVQQACLQLALPKPAGVYDSLDETAQLMGAVANLAGMLLTDNFSWQDLQEKYEIIGDGVTKEFPLPDDFACFVDNTGWSMALRRPVLVLNAQQWAAISAWLSQSFYINPACRIYQNKLQFMSAPPDTAPITFQYKIRNWVIDGDDPAVLKDILTKNTDKPRFDWMMMVLAIKVKWLEQKGMNTLAAQSDLNDRYFQLTSKDEVAPILQLSGPVPGQFRYLDNFYNTPDTNIGLP